MLFLVCQRLITSSAFKSRCTDFAFYLALWLASPRAASVLYFFGTFQRTALVFCFLFPLGSFSFQTTCNTLVQTKLTFSTSPLHLFPSTVTERSTGKLPHLHILPKLFSGLLPADRNLPLLPPRLIKKLLVTDFIPMAELSRDLKKVCLISLMLGAYPNLATISVGSIQVMLKTFPFQAVMLSGSY